jgi:hypothetical protein
MTIRTSLIAIGATLALIAPAAASARAIVNQKGDTYLSSKHGSHALVNSTSFVSENGHVASRKAKTNSGGKLRVERPGVVYSAPFGSNPIVTPGYIYSPGPINPSAYVDPNECRDSGSNCTDIELCTYWGENCDIAAAVPQDAAPAGDTH